MSLFDGFDANEVDPNVGFEELPAGKYVAVIASSEEKRNSRNTGSFLALKFQVVEGQYAKRVLFVNLNLDNPNTVAVQIARGELSAICRAIGVPVPRDGSELHDKPMVIKVGFEKDKVTEELRNVIKGYEKYGAGNSVAPPTNTAVTGVPPQNASPQNSWMSNPADSGAVPF